MKSEMRQLHIRENFEPRHRHELLAKERSKVLESHMLLKLKIDGKIKGQAVTGGNKERDFIPKEYSSLLTVATKAVLLSCIIDLEDERYVAVINIPNVFIQTRVKNKN